MDEWTHYHRDVNIKPGRDCRGIVDDRAPDSHQLVGRLRFLGYAAKGPILEREAATVSPPLIGWQIVAIDAIAENGQSEVARTRRIPNDLQDCVYWNLKRGERGQISILGKTFAPGSEDAAKDPKWPVFWIVQHPAKKQVGGGRVFCSVIGHYDQVQEDPFFRLIMWRAVAWCLNEPFAPFKLLAAESEQSAAVNADKPRD